MDFLNQYSTEIIIAIIGLLAGVAITIKVINNKNKVNQNGNIVGGDQAGRDINKK